MKRIISAIMLVIVFAITVIAQSNTGRLVGTVSSPDGVVPGATVVVTDTKTKKDKTLVTGGDGGFILPQLEVGAYTVKVTMQGFKTFTANDVKIDIGRDYSLPVSLEVGKVEDTVTVTAGNDVLNATTGELSTTISTKQILELPLNGRNPISLISTQAGVSQNGAQNSSINGLRTSFTNITRDGINIQDGFIRSNATDFAPNRPSVDDTGEFTVILQNAGADQNGGAQIRLVTPRGESKFHGAGFEFNRNSALASNDFFNNKSGISIPFLNRNNYGGKLSGPMPIPHFGEGGPSFYRDKGFFFFSYEGIVTRQASQRTRTILLPNAATGNFTYKDTAGVTRTVNLFSLVPASAGITGVDPLIKSSIINALPTVGNRTDIGDQLNTTGYGFSQKSNSDRKTYTTRLDYDINERNSINGVFSYNKENNLRPDVDGGQGFGLTPTVVQSSANKQFVLAYRWTPAARFSNDARGGTFQSVVPFEQTVAKPNFFIAPTVVSNPIVTFLSQGRRTRQYMFQDNADLTVKNHTIRFGGQLQFQEVDAYNEASIVPTYSLGTNTNTPTLSATQFTGGISTTQLATANALMALLGGVVSSGAQSFNVADKTSGFKAIQRFQDFRYGDHSIFAQDSWRVKPSFTLTLGLRYELFTALKLNNGLALEPIIPSGATAVQAILDPNGSSTFLGTNIGSPGQYHRTDKNNFAPTASFAWSPRFSNKLMKGLLGDGRTVIRGGYRWSFLNDQLITALNNATAITGLGTTGVSALNPSTNTTALNTRVGLLPASAPIAAPAVVVPRTFAQNNTAAFSNFGTIWAINPDIQTPRVDEFNLGIQREFGNNVIEVRYAGHRANNLWRGIDYNQIDIRNNGFLADFVKARQNLVLSGNVSGAYNSAIVGSQPLTVFPNLGSAGLLTNATIRNSLIAGTPADLALTYIQNALTGTVKFLPNANSGVVDYLTNGSISRYNALQVEYRRRISRGLQISANYSFQKVLTDGVGTGQTLFEPLLDNSQPKLEYTRADYDQNHIFNFTAVYELPIGRSRRFFGNMNKIADAIIGGWQISPILKVASGAPITITDVRGTLNRAGRSGRQTALTSLSKEQVKALTGLRINADNIWFVDPTITNTTGRAAEGFGTTAFTGQVFFNNAPGQTGNLERAVFNGPRFVNIDAALAKNFKLAETVKLQVRLEGFNALNHTQFFFGQFPDINSTTFGKVSSTFGPRIVQLGARLDF